MKLAEVDGLVMPLAQCDWVMFDSCGCPSGVCVASYAPTEEQAWKEFYDCKRDRRRAQRKGMRLELMSHARYSRDVLPKLRVTWSCPHGPPPMPP